MPRKPSPRFMIGRAQAAPDILPMAADGERLIGARQVPIDQVVPDPGQPRRDWDDDESVARLAELAASLKEFGVLEPV